MARPEERRFDDVVVASDVWASLETAALVRSLAGALAEQGTRDAVTGLVNRHSIVHTLTTWAASLAGSQRRLVVVLLDVNGFAAVNAAHGLGAGDAVLRELGRRVTAAVPQGCVVGRSGDDELLTVALLPATSDESAREYGEVLRRRVAAAVDAPAHSLPWPSVRTSTAVSRPGWADAELLLQEVHRTLTLVGV
nr:GGDEF domain-containing protein [Cellulomonas sp. JH27-2]